MNREYSLYQFLFPNGKKYIGITRQVPKIRWKNGQAYTRNFYLYNAITKYGWETIEKTVLYSELTKEEAEQLEIETIKNNLSSNKEFGYNISLGGNCKGAHSLETREKLSRINKGKKMSEETKEKQRKRMMGNKYNLGRKMSNEKKATLLKVNSKKVIQLDKNYNFLVEYVSIREAERQTKANSGHISAVCNGKRKTAGGYKWEYCNENN
jgi:group I intron endonuclease